MSGQRIGLSKRTRFEVFKRDDFTCQYCGAQPPSVVLEVDHIDSVSHGGRNDAMNLVTSCEACNRGKSDKALTTKIPRPDADAAYLATMQEVAEVERYQAALADRQRALTSLCDDLCGVWGMVAGEDIDWHPSDGFLMDALRKVSPEAVEEAVRLTAWKVSKEDFGRYNNGWDRYFWGVAWRFERGDRV